MLTGDEIKTALHASRVVEIPQGNYQGPLGLEHLAFYFADIMNTTSPKIGRSLELSTSTWEKLEHLATSASKRTAEPITVSDVVTAMVEQFASATMRS